MDIQKDINKEVLKSDEEKVEDLAKDAEDLEKAVEKDIEDKVEKVEEINGDEAEPLDAKDGSGKAVKDVVASDKEFKEEQEREDAEFPEVKKSELEEGLFDKFKNIAKNADFARRLVAREGQYKAQIILDKLTELTNSGRKEDVQKIVSNYTDFDKNMRYFGELGQASFNDAALPSTDPEEIVNDFIKTFGQKQEVKPFTEKLELNESDEEDLRKDANSLSDYLSKNKLYCDLEDYEMYPLGVKVVTFRVEGDWKHDHWYFNTLVEKWAKENGKEIWKIDENIVEEDGSDYYTADHKVYITDKETSDRLNSMRGLFAPKEESLKEDLTSSSWGSNFKSDVYNALSKIAFKYYRKDVNLTDDDWIEAVEWFITHFDDDNPFYESLNESVSPDLINAIMWNYGCSKTEASKKAKSMDEERKKLLIKGFKDNAKKSFYSESLKESAEKFIITKVGDNKYALAKGNPPVVNARKTITAKSPEEAKQILVDSGWYSEDELVIESLKESYFKLCGYTSGSAEDGIESDRFDTYAVVEAPDKKDAYKQFTNIMSEKEIKDKGLYITGATEQEYKEYLDDLDYLNNLQDAPLDESKLDEALPSKSFAKALMNLEQQEKKNSGGAYYRIPGSKNYSHSYAKSTDVLNNSDIDWQKADFTKISPEEAINIFKQDPRRIALLIDGHAILFDQGGNHIGRVEWTSKPVTKRTGAEVRDTKKMKPWQLFEIADEVYETNYFETLRDKELLTTRKENPESSNYEGPDAEQIEREASLRQNSYSWGISNEKSRGVSDKLGYYDRWRDSDERRLKDYKEEKERIENILNSRDDSVTPNFRRGSINRLDDLETKIAELESKKKKADGLKKDYAARKRYLAAEISDREKIVKFKELKQKVENSDWKVRSANRELEKVKERGGTWSYGYDKEKLAEYQAKIIELQGIIAELERRLAAQEASGANSEELRQAEEKVNKVTAEAEANTKEMKDWIDRLRANSKAIKPRNESLEEDLTIIKSFATYEPWGQAVNTFKRIEKADKLEEAEAILEELYPEGITETSLNDILAFEPEWLLNELGIADDEEKAMLEL